MVYRKAAVAGTFYPRFKSDLINLIKESFLDTKFGPGEEVKSLNLESRSIIGGVSPHAGYVYSGSCAAFTYLNLFKEKTPDTIIILGTDHIGYGKIALLKEGKWETPLGDLNIDSELASEIFNQSKVIKADDSAFIGFPFGREHNIEVQLPFIKYCAHEKDINIVPVKISTKDYNKLEVLSTDIASAINKSSKDIVIVASSDMTHKQPQDSYNPKSDLNLMRELDNNVINAFVELNPKKVLEEASKTSVCGPQTIATLILICKKLQCKKGLKLKYYNSYEKTGGSGPCEYSVGYFSGVITK